MTLPAQEEEYDGQSEQIPGPKPALYWFVLQFVHEPPFSPVYPALHSQAVFAILPGAENELDIQPTQLGPSPAL